MATTTTTTASPQQQAAQQQQQAAGAPGAAPPANTQPSRWSRNDAEFGDFLNDRDPDSSLILRYPQNLGSEEHLHWVVFYPLIRKGKNKQNKPSTPGANLQIYESGANAIDSEKKAKAAIETASVVTGFQTGAAAGLMEKFLSLGGNANGQPAQGVVNGVAGGLGKVASTAANGLIGGTVGAAGGAMASMLYNALADNLSNVYIGDTCIALHVSEKISTSYSANWDVADLGGLIAAVGSGATSVVDALATGDGADYIARKLGKISSVVGGDLLANTIEASTKRVENPYKQQLFKSMGFRKFTFDYKFSPRNAYEAAEVFGEGHKEYKADGSYKKGGILYTFLRHMHPEKSATNMFLEYPSEFVIIYYYMGEENQFVRKVSNCALVNMSIDYGAEGMTAIYDTGGIPSECTIRLEFVELETLTGDRIQKGF